MPTKPKVFISHTTRDIRDSTLAHTLAAGLRERGAEVLIAPDSIPPGYEWKPHLIQRMLKECTHFLVLLSAASSSAEWVLREIELARQRYTASQAPQILPLYLGKLDRFEGDDFLSRFQKVPYRENPLAQVDAVAAAVGLRLPGRSPAPDIPNSGRRFWIRRGKLLRLSFDGFLPDPEAKAWKELNPDVVPFESISQFRCLALLGEPGTGKSTALQAIYAGLLQRNDDEERPRPLLVDLKECTSEALLTKYLFESAEFKTWRNSEGTLDLFLDSLDECLIHTQTVARNLLAEFKRCPLDRLRLRIACRTAEWPELLSHQLPALWGKEQYGDYEIAPLRRDDVAEAARLQGLDPDAFLTAIKDRDVVPLALKPMTLNLLLSAFKEGNQLPGTLHALYETGCERLCEDPSLDRAASRTEGKLPPAHRLKLAERIAAVTLLSKRPSIYLGVDKTRAPKECATLDDLSYGSAKLGGKTLPVTHEHIRETLQTGLFTGGSGERLVTWSHWTFPEFLAARFLAMGRFSITQMKELLLSPDVMGRLRVIPPLQETAAWLAGMVPEFLQELIPLAPELLLRNAAMTSDDGLKAQLVDALLRQFDASKFANSDFDLRRRYDVLKHPTLGTQLLPYLRDRSKSLLARGTAISIAEECKEETLAEELLKLALDDSENLSIRCVSVEAIGALKNHEAHEKLRPLLHVEGDLQKDLMARVLQVLWPRYLSAETLFECLTPPQNQRHFGIYSHFLSMEVVKHLKPEDLPLALRWVEGKSDNSYLRLLVDAILRMAWTQLDVPQVREQFVHITLARLKLHQPLFDVTLET
ncbi:MAG TPA: TIR domain-containing protein, partial [Myxococcaceae bacterium]